MLITGDFNIHVDKLDDPDCKTLLSMISSLGLDQEVKTPTHRSGHILDLLITRKCDSLTCINPTSDWYVSDHCTVTCELNIECPSSPTPKTISYRKWKDINIDNFKTDLSQSDLIVNPPDQLESLISCYNSTLLALLDKHAPMKTKTIVVRPKVPWLNHRIRHAKRQRRQAERKWRSTKSECHHQTFKDLRNKTIVLMNEARREFYTDFVTENSNNQRQLFKATTRLMNLEKEMTLPVHTSSEELANQFGDYFVTKIRDIRSSIGTDDSNSDFDPDLHVTERTTSHPCAQLSEFQTLDTTTTEKLLSAMSSKSCVLDPAPTPVIKQCKDIILPVLKDIINLSFLTDTFPDVWKEAIITPILKKPSDDPVLSNYRPISNLPFISKLCERAAFNQINLHLSQNCLYPVHQSAYRANHSTETALLKIRNDILLNMNKQKVTLLVLLDLSAAFDTIDSNILKTRLQSSFGITGKSLSWISSYMTDRYQRVCINGEMSQKFRIDHGVPQGSCLGPLLFTLYGSEIFNIISKHLPTGHGYADDTQLYLAFNPNSLCDQQSAIQSMQACIEDIRVWMKKTKLKLNDSKTEFLIIGTRAQLSKVQIDHLKVGSTEIKPSSSVRNLGVWFDSKLDMKEHINKTCRASSYYLYNIRRIRKYLSPAVTEILIHAFISSRLDYCNSLLFGAPAILTDKLQRIQNMAARLIKQVTRYHHTTPLLYNLHWLPIRFRINYKIIILTFKALHQIGPPYLQGMLSYKKQSGYKLRCTLDNTLLELPRFKSFKTLGDCSFLVAAPALWNALPKIIRDTTDFKDFKTKLKTHLFLLAFK